MSEEITTIFVVGFPDDMKEREFQNMFTFSQGFEAATLKIPSPDETDKDNQKKQIIGFAKFNTRLEALEARDILTGRKVDVEKNCALKAEMAKKNLHTRRGPSSLGLSTAVAATFGLDTPTTALGFQQQQQQQQQPQQSQQPQQPQTAHILPSQQSQTPQAQTSQAQTQQTLPLQTLPRTASLTNTMLASAHRPEHLRITAASRTFNPFNDIPLASAPILGASSHRSFSSNQFSSAFSSSIDQSPSPATAVPGVSAMGSIPATASVMGGYMYSDHQLSTNLSTSGAHSNMLLARRGSVHSSTPVSSSLALSGPTLPNGLQSTPSQHQALSEPNSSDGEALQMISQPQQQSQIQQPQQQQQQQQQTPVQPELSSQSLQQPPSSQGQQLPGQQQQQQQPPSVHKGLASQRPAVLDIAALQPRLNQLNLGQLSAASIMSPMGAPYSASVTTPVGMVLPMATTRSVNSNDQNPPCNTLYVGNLPTSAKEEELRQLFRGAIGYKRMSYRAKPNSGPMCFVEFESIDFATLAMSELDGRMLSTSVGSGIRLSYSKNPLGVRSQNNPPGSATLSSAAAAAAAVAMSGGYHAVNGSPYGYPMSALQTPLQQQSQPQQSQPQQQQLREMSPIHHQGVAAAFRQAATPSPPTSAPGLNRSSTMGGSQLQSPFSSSGGGGSISAHSRNNGSIHSISNISSGQHQHHPSISSSSQASPLPSPNTATHSSEQQQQPGNVSANNVPKDALSFLHQPIHQLHKQATGDHPSIGSAGSTTPPQSGAASNTASTVASVALDQ